MSIDINSTAYRDAYSRINGMVIVGEGLADRHFRLLAKAIPADRAELERLAVMEGRHARDFVGCGRHLGIQPDVALARGLFAPLHALFLRCDQAGDLPGCLTLQGIIVECFALAAYQHYLPVADAYAKPITSTVMADEDEHLGYAERWLSAHNAAVSEAVSAVCRQALPITLRILQRLSADMKAIGIDPIDLLASFSALFVDAMVSIGCSAKAARRLLAGAAAATLMA